MAVYERKYRGYKGELTPSFSRFLVLPRYAFGDVFAARIVTGFYFLCFVFPVISALVIYIRHNQRALEALNMSLANLMPVNAAFFRAFLIVQAAVLGFILLVSVGPPLVANDLRNNGLPLYLSRPFTRFEYVLGKLAVLAILLSAITWIPGLLLFGLEASLAGNGWFGNNLHLASAVFVGSWVWILPMSLCALAISAWVKMKPLASGLLIAMVLVGNGYAASVNSLLGTIWGHLFSITTLVDTIWLKLLHSPQQGEIPVWSAWFGVAMLCAMSLLMLWRKVRAYEVAG